jgi:hypothetical protein
MMNTSCSEDRWAAGVDLARLEREQHRTTFFVMPFANGNFWLLLLGIGGLTVLWGPRGRRWRGRRLLLTLWLGMSVAFTLYLWEPIWDHYCIQYLPVLAVLAAVFLHALWTRATAGRWMRGRRRRHRHHRSPRSRRRDSRRRVSLDLLARPAQPGEAWLTFDLFVNFVTGTVPACGVIDPINTYGSAACSG